MSKPESTILVVDDTEANIDILLELLSDNYKITVAMDGESALESVADGPPDLILLDIMMPGMDGYQVIEHLKADEATKNIPVIFITAKSETADEAKGLSLGAVDYITKPISPSIVKARVSNYLELKKLRDQQTFACDFIQKEKDKTDDLLANVLPKSVADQLKNSSDVIAEQYESATVLFADIVGFTKLSGEISAIHVVEMLNEIFTSFDVLVEKHGLEKIKTIGDAYMVVGGLLERDQDHAEAIADLALDMLDEINTYSQANNDSLSIRIGINTGPVVAGVIGVKKYVFDLWGDAVNIASRMESHGIPGYVHSSSQTYHLLKNKYRFTKRGMIHIKGKGEMLTYVVVGKNGDNRRLAASKELLDGMINTGLSMAAEELKTMSLSDELTGLYSRSGLVAYVKQLVKSAKRTKRNVLLLLVCLDNLDEIIENISYQEGDIAIIEVAELLTTAFRTTDIIGRVGDNLFLVIGEEVTEVNESILSNRFNKIVENNNIERLNNYELSLKIAEAKWDQLSNKKLEDLLAEMEKNVRSIS